MKFPKFSKPNLNLPHEHVRTTTITIFVVLILSILYHVIFAHRIIPGVKVGSVKVGGMTYQKAKWMKKWPELKLIPW